MKSTIGRSQMWWMRSNRCPTPEPQPSIEDIVKKVVDQALDYILASNLHMMKKQTEEMQGLFKGMDAWNTRLQELMRTQIEKTEDLSERLKAFEFLLQINHPSPKPSPQDDPSQPTDDLTSSHPIDVDLAPHPFTHDISPKLPFPSISSGHVSPSQISQPSSPVPTTRSPDNTPTSGLLQHTDLIIHQVLTDIGQQTSKPAEAATSAPSKPPEPTASAAATHPDDVNKRQEGNLEGKADE